MPWWDDALVAIPELAEEDPWSAADLAELDRMLKQADDEHAMRKADAAERVAAERERRSAWGGKPIKTVEGMVVFVESQALLDGIASYADQHRDAGSAAADVAVALRSCDARDVPCQIISRELRPAARGESGKFMVLRPLLPSISHLQIREVHSSALAPMHARFGEAWGRHATCAGRVALGEAASAGGSPGDSMRDALIEAVRRQQACVATRVSSAELFRSFAPGADVPASLEEPGGGTGDDAG
mmetsp:Transcript_9839/g.31705  ORF Transcript_9839/g.31705 Transcript_9839/m.31705 type:complete len:244 (-) Transcript_9839:205-936(-)